MTKPRIYDIKDELALKQAMEDVSVDLITKGNAVILSENLRLDLTMNALGIITTDMRRRTPEEIRDGR